MPAATREEDTGPSELKRVIRSVRPAFVFAAIFTMFINLLMLTQPFYMLQIFDRVLQSESLPTLGFLTLIVFGLFTLMGALQFIRSRLFVRVGVKLDRMMSARLFESMYRDSLERPSADSSQALDDMTNVRQFLTGPAIIGIFDAPWTPIFLALMFFFHPLLGWYGVGCIIVICALSYANELVSRKPLAQANQANRKARRFTANNLRNSEVIHAMGMGASIRKRWGQRQGEIIDTQAQASDKSGTFSNLSRTVRLMAQVLAYGLGAYLVITSNVSGGMVIAGAILIGRVLAPIDQIIGSWRQIAQARMSYGRLEELLDRYPEEPRHLSLPRPEGRLQVQSLMAGPATNQRIPVLRNISFTLEPGQSLGVIGPSGAGKSSLARAILGVWPIFNGVVRLDGAEINQYNREELGPHIGYLPQDIELFEGTIAENIARFSQAEDSAIIAAAQHAGAHELIVQLPNGYDTPVGVGGNTLSAGQRQRIGLARALFGEPRVVILDEPNSNLDDAGEKALEGALQWLKESGSTVIVITHKRNVLRQLEKLMVIRNGRVAGFGTRDEVLAKIQPGRKPPRVSQDRSGDDQASGDDSGAEDSA